MPLLVASAVFGSVGARQEPEAGVLEGLPGQRRRADLIDNDHPAHHRGRTRGRCRKLCCWWRLRASSRHRRGLPAPVAGLRRLEEGAHGTIGRHRHWLIEMVLFRCGAAATSWGNIDLIGRRAWRIHPMIAGIPCCVRPQGTGEYCLWFSKRDGPSLPGAVDRSASLHNSRSNMGPGVNGK